MREERFSTLIADPDPRWAKRLGYELDQLGHKVEMASSLAETLEALSATPPDFVVLGLADASWVQTTRLKELRSNAPEACFIALAPDGRENTEQALKQVGLTEIVPHGMPVTQLANLIRHYAETRRLKENLERYRQLLECRTCFESLVGGSAAMRGLYRLIEQVARADSSVLVTGEKGSEFDEVARAIHQRSGRAPYPLVSVDCTQEKREELEKTVLGPAGRGAYADGPSASSSAFARAGKGAVLLHNVEECSANLQRRLYEFLRTPFFQGETSSEPHPIARLMATTSADIDRLAAEGRFSRDLLNRMNILQVRVPPLRDRREDIPLLAERFLQSTAEGVEDRPKQSLSFTHETLLQLFQHQWPGNVAELAMAIQIAAARTKTKQIEPHDLPEDMIRKDAGQPARVTAPSTSVPLRDAKRAFEAEYFRNLLERTRGNMTMASRVSKVGRPYLYKKLKEYAIDPESFR